MPDHPITELPLPSPEAVRQQLQAILDSRPFVTATRARRFLTYIVEETLTGRTDAIKELVLGIEVCDRPGDFDPKVDTIVRVEAGKLRKRLEEYYAGQGVAAPVGSRSPQVATSPSSIFATNLSRWTSLALPPIPFVTRPAFVQCSSLPHLPGGESGAFALPNQ